MKKVIKYLCVLIIGVFFLNMNVWAEDTSCSYASQAELVKLAGEVKANYDFNYSGGKTSFDIKIYNVSDAILINIKNLTDVNAPSYSITKNHTTNGIFTFNSSSIDKINEYEIEVMAAKYGCAKSLRKMRFVTPMRNVFHDLDECRYSDVADYLYCQEWVTSPITLKEKDVLKKIGDYRDSKKIRTTTKCVACEKTKQKEKEQSNFLKYKISLIIANVVGMILDLTLIVLYVKKVRSSEF